MQESGEGGDVKAEKKMLAAGSAAHFNIPQVCPVRPRGDQTYRAWHAQHHSLQRVDLSLQSRKKENPPKLFLKK